MGGAQMEAAHREVELRLHQQAQHGKQCPSRGEACTKQRRTRELIRSSQRTCTLGAKPPCTRPSSRGCFVFGSASMHFTLYPQSCSSTKKNGDMAGQDLNKGPLRRRPEDGSPCTSELTIPVSQMSSIAFNAADALEYLQNTTPLDAIKSVLQYSKSGYFATSS